MRGPCTPARHKYWQAAAYVGQRNYRASTKMEGITSALRFAEEWYLELRGKHVRGDLKKLVPANAEKPSRTLRSSFYGSFPSSPKVSAALSTSAATNAVSANTSYPSSATSRCLRSPRVPFKSTGSTASRNQRKRAANHPRATPSTRKWWPSGSRSRLPSAMAGSLTCQTCLSPIAARARSPTARGSRRLNTESSTWRPRGARRTPSTNVSAMRASSSMTT